MELKITQEERKTAAWGYIFGVPALYIILTEYRHNRFLSFHAARAFVLWVAWILQVLAVRLLFNFIWHWFYLWVLDPLAFLLSAGFLGFIVSCGYRVYKGIDFEVPWATEAALALW